MNKPRPLDELLAAAETANRLAAEAKAARLQVGQGVRHVRHSIGMTQQSFAAALGHSQSYVSQIETGERTPSTPTMNMIASLATNAKEFSSAKEEEDSSDN